MNAAPQPSARIDQDVIDVVFALHGHAIARDHACALRAALLGVWPWLGTDAVAAIHPIKLVPGNEALGLLSGRSRLLLRVQAERGETLAGAGDVQFDLLGQTLRLGPAQPRALRPHSAMYAYRVAAPGPDEAAFMDRIDRDMTDLGISAARVCGKHQLLNLQGQPLDAFSLLLHEMTPRDALILHQVGLGEHGLLGCGVFVPHKSAAAV